MNRKVLKMTNREKLLNTNIYDLLITLNQTLLEQKGTCIIDILEQKYNECGLNSCANCIQKYLNKEV